MPTERLAMHHVRDVIRLNSAGAPIREVARRIGSCAFNPCAAADPPVRGGGPELAAAGERRGCGRPGRSLAPVPSRAIGAALSPIKRQRTASPSATE